MPLDIKGIQGTNYTDLQCDACDGHSRLHPFTTSFKMYQALLLLVSLFVLTLERGLFPLRVVEVQS